ncbi:MAG: ABC transporter ATP-binding protein [Planctomycetes bacterium]|nr:ABC transporter ATP-binding protein [Planctomycetota bacterium]
MIEAEGLTKLYRNFAAIDNVSFKIPKGQIVAFLGPNGAGKTTTMRILTGFLPATSGKARLAGFDVTTQRLQAAARVGYLPENGPLYLDMTPRRLLRFFGEARGMESDRIAARIEAVVKLCAIAEVFDKPIRKLSRGFRQRVGMAHALLHEPDILIMDEPTSGLDPNQIRDVRGAIRELGRDRTILLSTHILQEVEAVADRVLFIHAGKIVFDGTVREFDSRGPNKDEVFHLLTGARS